MLVVGLVMAAMLVMRGQSHRPGIADAGGYLTRDRHNNSITPFAHPRRFCCDLNCRRRFDRDRAMTPATHRSLL
jgi:hypothetical protein